jgi:hypothetical protein
MVAMTDGPMTTTGAVRPPISRRRIWIVRGIAIAADAVQIGFMPLFAEGIASPVNDVLDVVVAMVLILLVGWHVAFIPSFIIKVLPFADLAPTWTLAALIATRGKKGEQPEGHA